MLIGIENNIPKDQLRIELMLGNLCNHKCSYCFPGSNEGDAPWPNLNLLTKNLCHLLDRYIEFGKKNFKLYLIGGETTLWKDLPKFCKYIKSKYDIQINISTNGSRSTGWWFNNADCFDNVEISVHHEFAKIEHIKRVADIIYEKNIFVNCNVLFDYAYFNKCKDIVKELSKNTKRWPILAKTVLISGKTYYNDEQSQYLENSLKRWPNPFWYFKVKKNDRLRVKLKFDNGKTKTVKGDNYLMLKGLNSFKGWQCNIGVDHISIFKDGTIKGNCMQTLYGNKFDYNLYRESFENEFQPTIGPVTCSQKLCSCSGETIINKSLN